MVKPISAPICPYCGGDAVLVRGSVIWPTHNDLDLHEKRYWFCAGDRAWVGCHKSTERPLGTLADAQLRKARERAHKAFDPIWQEKARRKNIAPMHARGKGYRWLGEMMKLKPGAMHIGMLDLAQCARVVEICQPVLNRLRKK